MCKCEHSSHQSRHQEGTGEHVPPLADGSADRRRHEQVPGCKGRRDEGDEAERERSRRGQIGPLQSPYNDGPADHRGHASGDKADRSRKRVEYDEGGRSRQDDKPAMGGCGQEGTVMFERQQNVGGACRDRRGGDRGRRSQFSAIREAMTTTAALATSLTASPSKAAGNMFPLPCSCQPAILRRPLEHVMASNTAFDGDQRWQPRATWKSSSRSLIAVV